jgi:heme-degrading monooxygenase HmoA
MIVRVWRTGLDESRAAEYDRFAMERSLPLFRRQPGLRGVLFTHSDNGPAVITFWADRTAVDALESSAEYRETAAAISATGFLRSPQTVDVLEVDGGWIPSELGLL